MVRIADAYPRVEEVGALGEPQVDLERQVAQPLPLPEAEHLAAVGGGDAGGVERGTAERGVPGGAGVPFDAAGEPGAGEAEVGVLQDGVGVQQFTARGLVVQRVQAAAETGQDGGAQPVVLQDDRVQRGGHAFAGVAVETRYGEQGAQLPVGDAPGHAGRERGALGGVEDVRVPGRAERGQGFSGPSGLAGRVRVVRRTVVAKRSLSLSPVVG